MAYQGDERSKLADSAAAFKDRLEISVRLHSDLTVNDGQESSQISEFVFFFLVDGFKHFLFSIIYGIILSYFSRWLKHVKTTNQLFFRACDLIIAFCPGFSG